MSTSNNSTDLCVTRQKIKIKNASADVYNVLVRKKSWKNIKKFV